ncbi:hypothetical protein [Massilia sp. CCM 8734]|uniref:hypothetical protein n=1 Tax=Massilia sp. CCM 8734 TaxID=2609283 RepID=UPI0014234F95|nr:hypothetical protein [Massilia sp. CCM 8734]NHZ94617.1 hypothetical protein [Massilia sp. CCM 8734]
MQRKENESFAAYKIRRAAANLAVKRLNWESKGDTTNVRASRPGKGMFARALSDHFAKAALKRLQRTARMRASLSA